MSKKLVIGLAAAVVVCAVIVAFVVVMPRASLTHVDDLVLKPGAKLHVTLKNGGKVAKTGSLAYEIDGKRQGDVAVSLSAGQTRSYDLSLDTLPSRGKHALKVGGDTVSFRALRPATYTISKLKPTARVVAAGRRVDVTCVATNVGDTAAIVAESGLVVPPRDARALASAIEALIGGRIDRNALASLARKRIETLFSLDACLQRYTDLFRKAATPEEKRRAEPASA